jgi:hypothetical protein
MLGWMPAPGATFGPSCPASIPLLAVSLALRAWARLLRPPGVCRGGSGVGPNAFGVERGGRVVIDG